MTKKKDPKDLKKNQGAPVAKLTVTKKSAPAPKAEPAGPRTILVDNWMALNQELKNMDESECLALIEHERRNKLRPNVILRLHGRFNKLRGQRERGEYMQPLK